MKSVYLLENLYIVTTQNIVNNKGTLFDYTQPKS